MSLLRPALPKPALLPADAERAELVRGLALMVAAMLVLPAMDAIAKHLSASIAPGQIAWARFAFQTLFTLPLVVAAQGWRGLVPRRLWGNAARGALIAVASTMFFVSVKYMPLAERWRSSSPNPSSSSSCRHGSGGTRWAGGGVSPSPPASSAPSS
jgi:hypothetical protein